MIGTKISTQDRCKLPPMQSGTLLALTSAVLFGASTPFAKLLQGAVNPWLMAGPLYLGADFGDSSFWSDDAYRTGSCYGRR
jgi:hypothetical protein